VFFTGLLLFVVLIATILVGNRREQRHV
jgi:hypothetical protein